MIQSFWSKVKTNGTLCLCLSVYLIICIPFIRSNFVFPDEGMIVQYAQRILFGEIPYRDFYAQVTPLTFYLNALFLKIFDFAFAGRILFLFEGVLIVILIHQLYSALNSKKYAIVGVLTFSCWSCIHWNFPHYSWDGALFFILATVSFLYWLQRIRNGQSTLFWTAMVAIGCFLSFLSKQNIGVFAYLAVGLSFTYAFYVYRKRSIVFSVLVFTAISLLLCFFILSFFQSFDVSPIQLVSTLFINGAKNKGGGLALFKAALPSINESTKVAFFGFFILLFTKDRVSRGGELLLSVVFAFFILFGEKELLLLRLYDFLFFYYLYIVTCGIFRKSRFDEGLIYLALFSLFLMFSNSLAGPTFGRKIVSLSLGGAICFGIFIQRFQVFYQASGNMKKYLKGFLIICFAFFCLQGLRVKEENYIFRALGPAVFDQDSSYTTSKLKYLTGTELSVKTVDSAVDFIKSKNLKKGDLFVYYGISVFYYLTDVPSFVPVDFFWADITPEKMIFDVLDMVKRKRPRYIVYNDSLDIEGNFRENIYINSTLIPAIQPLLKDYYSEVFRKGGIIIYKSVGSM